MFKPELLVYSVLAIIALFVGIAIGRSFELSQFATVGIGLVPALLIAFPIIRQWSNGHLTFRIWAIVVVGIGIAAMLINKLIGQ